MVRKAEIERAVKSITATGLAITRIEIDGSKLTIHTGSASNSDISGPEAALQEWRRKYGKG